MLRQCIGLNDPKYHMLDSLLGGSVQMQCQCAGDRPPEVLIGVCTYNLVKEGTLPMFLDVRPSYHIMLRATAGFRDDVKSTRGCCWLIKDGL